MSEYIRIHEKDNVAVALDDLHAGETVRERDPIILSEEIPRGHKFAVRTIRDGEDVIKYGYPIGKASVEIPAGAHVHTHNMHTNLSGELDYRYRSEAEARAVCPLPASARSFRGYERKDGRVGIRNEVWIVPTVGCVNANAKEIADKGQAFVQGTIDAIVPYSHPYGCSQLGEDQEHTRTALANLIRHPNAGGVLVLGLGCENSNIEVMKTYLGDYDRERVRFLVCQDVEDEIAAGIEIIRELAALCAKDVRSEQPLSKLVVGLKCGGSDGLSGITANPVVGGFSDLLFQAGGSSILTEVPEMFGAETILMDRAENQEIFHKTVSLINDFKAYFRQHGETISENPSPGNKAGGITTLEDKALGCTQKAGRCAPVVDVLRYTQQIGEAHGLYLLEAPGNDLVASTALAVSGAQLILFTTGRGTPYACPVPTMKLSSNSQLMEKKRGWIDFDCGRALNGETTIVDLSQELFDQVLATANGEYVKSEKAGYRDLAIWKQGVTL